MTGAKPPTFVYRTEVVSPVPSFRSQSAVQREYEMTEPRFVVDQAGNRVGVLLDLDEYNRLLKASGIPDSSSAREAEKGSLPAYTPEEKKLMEDRLESLGYL